MNIIGLNTFATNQYVQKKDSKETVLTIIGQDYLENLKKDKVQKDQESENIKKQIDDIFISNKISAINAKLKGGSELSNSELEFLRKNNPELYRKAKEIKEERKLYRKSLESCTTKEQVHTMHMMKITSLSNAEKKAEASGDSSGAEQIEWRLAASEDEYLKFTGSKKYNELPTESEIKNGKHPKKKATTFTVYYKNSKDKSTVNLTQNTIDKKA